MGNLNKAREQATARLADQYSRNLLSLEDYERLIDGLNRAETTGDLVEIERALAAGGGAAPVPPAGERPKRRLAVFSWRGTNAASREGSAGSYASVFGANQIIIDRLPPGKTTLNVASVFGLTEIIVPWNVRVINHVSPFCAGVFINGGAESGGSGDAPELYLTGTAVFGNVTVRRHGSGGAGQVPEAQASETRPVETQASETQALETCWSSSRARERALRRR